MSAQHTPCDEDHHDNVDTSCSEYATSCGWHVPCGSAMCHTWSGKVHSLVSPSSARRRSWTCSPRKKTLLSKKYIQPWSNEAIGGATYLPSFKLQSVGAQKVTASMMRASTPHVRRSQLRPRTLRRSAKIKCTERKRDTTRATSYQLAEATRVPQTAERSKADWKAEPDTHTWKTSGVAPTNDEIRVWNVGS